MSDLFFYGTLCHVPLLQAVIGRVPDHTEAALHGYAVYWAKDQAFPVILRETSGQAHGIVVQGLTPDDLENLEFYESGFDYDLHDVVVETSQGPSPAKVFLPSEGAWPKGADWSLADWTDRWGEMSVGAAHEVMRRKQTHPPAAIRQMLPFFRARAWAQEIARNPAPQTLRNAMTVDDVDLIEKGTGFNGFFTMNTFKLRHRQFDGAWSPVMGRECFMSFDVALVLPYDPVTDRVLLVEQVRFGPVNRGDPAPWVLEAIAGLVDAGESPEDAARRETVEEAHLELHSLHPMVKGYASPGYSTEFYHAYLGLCDLSQRGQSQGGLATENEDIRNHVIGFDRAMALLESGEINTAPLAMMLLWLANRRADLRKNA